MNSRISTSSHAHAGKRKGKKLTFPAALGDVDGVTLHHGRDSEADVARLAYCRRGRTLALLNRARDATADLQQGDVRRVEVKRAANTCVLERART